MLSLVYSRQRQSRSQPLGLQLGRAVPHFTTVEEPLSGVVAGQRLGDDRLRWRHAGDAVVRLAWKLLWSWRR